MHRILVALACSLSMLFSGGCSSWLPSFYKITVRQGNYIDRGMIAQIRTGMTKNQVQQILGSPLLTDPFHANRWDYVYTSRVGHGPMEERRVTLLFQGDVLTRIEGTDSLPP